LGVDALIDLPVVITPLPAIVYAGLGPTFTVAVEDSGFALQAFLGTDGNQPGGVFFEVGPTVELIPATDAGFLARAGFNYHFK
jgi:hypothetical protein